MIKVEELRRGNWVYDNSNYADKSNNGPIEVDSICSLGINVGISYESIDVDVEVEYLEPIKLTPEILERCGFELKYDFLYVKQYEPNSNLALRYIATTGSLFGEQTELDVKFFRLDGYCDIYFLHQLQNLYFALAAQELEVNLTQTA